MKKLWILRVSILCSYAGAKQASTQEKDPRNKAHSMTSYSTAAARACCFDQYMFSSRYGGFSFGMPLPTDLQLDIKSVPKNRTLSKVSLCSSLLLLPCLIST